jgi:hypothetical protein
MEGWLLNWTAFLARNTHAEIDGISYEDGPEWFELMWESWLKHSDYGRRLEDQIASGKVSLKLEDK